MSTQFMSSYSMLLRPLLFITTLALVILTGCTTIQTDSDPRVNMHNYHTYQLEYSGNSNAVAFNNPLNAKRLRDAVETNLASRGMRPVAEGETPDCIVSVSTGSRQVVESDPGTHVGLGWGWFGRGFGGSLAWDNDVRAYSEYRIAIDLIDAKSHEPVWHASINENINRGSGASADTRIRTVVAQLFTKFP